MKNRSTRSLARWIAIAGVALGAGCASILGYGDRPSFESEAADADATTGPDGTTGIVGSDAKIGEVAPPDGSGTTPGQDIDATTGDAGDAAAPLLPTTNRLALATRGGCLVVDGGLVCWGDAQYRIGEVRGNLGFAADASFLDGGIVFPPHAVPFASPIEQLAMTTGDTDSVKGRTCAVSQGTLRCWGDHEDEMAAFASGIPMYSPVPFVVEGMPPVTMVGLGESHDCALVTPSPGATTNVWCWGTSPDGRLGNPIAPGIPRHEPRYISAHFFASALSVGRHHNCAIADDRRSVVCWGLTDRLQSGPPTIDGGCDGYPAASNQFLPCTTTISPVKIDLPSGDLLVGLALGYRHSCAATSTAVYCWGDNRLHQLGTSGALACKLGGSACSDAAVLATDVAAVRNGRTIAGITAGFNHTCVRFDDRQAFCWGDNGNAQLARSDSSSLTIVQRSDSSPFAFDEVVAEADETCGRIGEEVWCWGDGVGVRSDRPTQVR